MISTLIYALGIWLVWIYPLLISGYRFVRGDYDRHWISYWIILAIVNSLELLVFRIESDNTLIFLKSLICILLYSEKTKIAGSLWDTSNDLVLKVKENLQESRRMKELSPEKLEALTNIAMSFDMEQLSKYMEDDETLPVTKFPLHPWAEKPKSLACLAVARVGYLASENLLNDRQLSDIMDFYIPEKIFNFLDSEHIDRRQNSLLALSFLLDIENINIGFNISTLIYQHKVCDQIMKYLQDSDINVKITAIHCFFHLLKYQENVQKWFIAHDGIQLLKDVIAIKDQIAVLEVTMALLQMVTVIIYTE